MIIDLKGVWDDGTNYAPNVSPSTATTIQFFAGSSVVLRLCVITNNGALMTQTGAAVVFRVKQSTGDGLDLISKDGVAVLRAPGRWDFTLDPADTSVLVPGRYVFDVWLTQGTGDAAISSPVVQLSALFLAPSNVQP